MGEEGEPSPPSHNRWLRLIGVGPSRGRLRGTPARGETRPPAPNALGLRAAAGKMCRCGCCGVLTVVVILMFAASWSSLDFQEFGLDYNSIRQTVNPIADGSGRYFLGVGHSFLIFPKVYQTIEYSQAEGRTGPPVQSRTKDGVEVILSVSFQYQLQRESIYDLFTTYGLNIDGESADGSEAEIEPYRKVFSYVARDILTDVSTEYNAFEFFSNRTNIGDRMWQELRRTFEEDYFSTVAFFQLKDVDLPDEFEHAIQDAEVSRQYQQRAREIQTRLLIEAETSVIQAEFTRQIYHQEASAVANATLLRNNFEIKAFNFTQANRLESYSVMMRQLGMTSAQLIDYIQVSAASANTADSIISLQGIGDSTGSVG